MSGNKPYMTQLQLFLAASRQWSREHKRGYLASDSDDAEATLQEEGRIGPAPVPMQESVEYQQSRREESLPGATNNPVETSQLAVAAPADDHQSRGPVQQGPNLPPQHANAVLPDFKDQVYSGPARETRRRVVGDGPVPEDLEFKDQVRDARPDQQPRQGKLPEFKDQVGRNVDSNNKFENKDGIEPNTNNEEEVVQQVEITGHGRVQLVPARLIDDNPRSAPSLLHTRKAKLIFIVSVLLAVLAVAGATLGAVFGTRKNEEQPPTAREDTTKAFETTEELYEAVDNVLTGNRSLVLTYGEIGDWDVSRIRDFGLLFYPERDLPVDYFAEAQSSSKTVFNADLSRWNTSNAESMYGMFAHAGKFNTDISNWDVGRVKNMTAMFAFAHEFNQDLSGWVVEKVEDMTGMFVQAFAFDQDLSGWNVSSVQAMPRMFYHASSFNSDIFSWDVSAVSDTSSMFAQASALNQDLSRWRVNRVTSFRHMFWNATSFNQDLSNWDVSAADDMTSMFSSAVLFNGDISTWMVSKVRSMRFMFAFAPSFNQNIGSWDVSLVENMEAMFAGATAFNQDLSNWNVTSLTTIPYMFTGASAFNGDISSWDVSRVIMVNAAFQGASVFNQNLNAWDVSSVSSMEDMFAGAFLFNHPLSSWNVSSVLDMSKMFQSAILFNQNISSWDVHRVNATSQMFFGAQSFDQDLCTWRMRLPTDTVVTAMFTGSGCLATNDPLLPQGPMCHQCTLL